MTSYPGVPRATTSYLVDSITTTVGLFFVMGVCCGLTLVSFGLLNPVLAGYALFAYLGLCLYLGQCDLNDDLQSVTDVSSSHLVAVLLGATIVLYYNAVVAVGAVLAGWLAGTALGNWALAVALLYPLYDSEMARGPAPLSIADGITTALLLVARVIERFQCHFDVESDGDTLDLLRRIGTSEGVLQDSLLAVFDSRWNRVATA